MSHSVCLYPYPHIVLERFIYNGLVYLKTPNAYFVNERNSSGMTPPEGRGFYRKFPAKDYKSTKQQYETDKHNWMLRNGHLEEEVQLTLSF